MCACVGNDTVVIHLCVHDVLCAYVCVCVCVFACVGNVIHLCVHDVLCVCMCVCFMRTCVGNETILGT